MNAVQFLDALLLGVGLSMDALAVSLALGATEGKNLSWKTVLLAASLFGIFQAGMPLLGWFGGALRIESAPGAGATASVELPLAETDGEDTA